MNLSRVPLAMNTIVNNKGILSILLSIIEYRVCKDAITGPDLEQPFIL